MRSASPGRPTDPAAEGHPQNWLVGGPDSQADVLLIIASDTRNDMLREVSRIERSLYPARGADGRVVRSGAWVISRQEGATLPQPLAGHEHFGFLDGVSQPGLRGRISDDPADVLTFRQNPHDREQGKPGQDLLWPGEFVFGYPGQDACAEDIAQPGNDVEPGQPGLKTARSWSTGGCGKMWRASAVCGPDRAAAGDHARSAWREAGWAAGPAAPRSRARPRPTTRRSGTATAPTTISSSARSWSRSSPSEPARAIVATQENKEQRTKNKGPENQELRTGTRRVNRELRARS